jgi:hypothetical protein
MIFVRTAHCDNVNVWIGEEIVHGGRMAGAYTVSELRRGSSIYVHDVRDLELVGQTRQSGKMDCLGDRAGTQKANADGLPGMHVGLWRSECFH